MYKQRGCVEQEGQVDWSSPDTLTDMHLSTPEIEQARLLVHGAAGGPFCGNAPHHAVAAHDIPALTSTLVAYDQHATLFLVTWPDDIKLRIGEFVIVQKMQLLEFAPGHVFLATWADMLCLVVGKLEFADALGRGLLLDALGTIVLVGGTRKITIV